MKMLEIIQKETHIDTQVPIVYVIDTSSITTCIWLKIDKNIRNYAENDFRQQFESIDSQTCQQIENQIFNQLRGE